VLAQSFPPCISLRHLLPMGIFYFAMSWVRFYQLGTRRQYCGNTLFYSILLLFYSLDAIAGNLFREEALKPFFRSEYMYSSRNTVNNMFIKRLMYLRKGKLIKFAMNNISSTTPSWNCDCDGQVLKTVGDVWLSWFCRWLQF